MSGAKENIYGFGQAKLQVTPDEVDQFIQYQIINPGLTATSLGTVSSATANASFVFDNIRPDYPRNVLVSILGVAGGMGGTVTVAGKNQFGGTQTETMGFASAASGGSVAGTKIFSLVNAATINGLDGLGGTAVGTARIGYAIGTAAGIINKLGLPTKIGTVTDLRNVTRSGQGVGGTAVNGGTILAAHVDLVNHAYLPPFIIAGSETICLTIKSTFDNSGKANMTTL